MSKEGSWQGSSQLQESATDLEVAPKLLAWMARGGCQGVRWGCRRSPPPRCDLGLLFKVALHWNCLLRSALYPLMRKEIAFENYQRGEKYSPPPWVSCRVLFCFVFAVVSFKVTEGCLLNVHSVIQKNHLSSGLDSEAFQFACGFWKPHGVLSWAFLYVLKAEKLCTMCPTAICCFVSFFKWRP